MDYQSQLRILNCRYNELLKLVQNLTISTPNTGTDNWQDTLDVSSILNKPNTIDGTGYDFIFDNIGTFGINTENASSLDALERFRITGAADIAEVHIEDADLFLDTDPTDFTADDFEVLVWNTATKQVGFATGIGGNTEGWQDALDISSVLDKDNTVDGTNHRFTWDNFDSVETKISNLWHVSTNDNDLFSVDAQIAAFYSYYNDTSTQFLKYVINSDGSYQHWSNDNTDNTYNAIFVQDADGSIDVIVINNDNVFSAFSLGSDGSYIYRINDTVNSYAGFQQDSDGTMTGYSFNTATDNFLRRFYFNTGDIAEFHIDQALLFLDTTPNDLTGGGYDVLVRDSGTGEVGTATVGSLQGWQNTLDVDNGLNKNNTVNGNNFDFVFDAFGLFALRSDTLLRTTQGGDTLFSQDIVGNTVFKVDGGLGSYFDSLNINFDGSYFFEGNDGINNWALLNSDAYGHFAFGIFNSSPFNTLEVNVDGAYSFTVNDSLSSFKGFEQTSAGIIRTKVKSGGTVFSGMQIDSSGAWRHYVNDGVQDYIAFQQSADGSLFVKTNILGVETERLTIIDKFIGVNNSTPTFPLDIIGATKILGAGSLIDGRDVNVGTLDIIPFAGQYGLRIWNHLNTLDRHTLYDDGSFNFGSGAMSFNAGVPLIALNNNKFSWGSDDSGIAGTGSPDEAVQFYSGSSNFYTSISRNGNIISDSANPGSPNASILLDLRSTTKGGIFPRMTNAQRLAIASPAIGLIVYQTDSVLTVLEGLYINKSGGWTFMV